LVLQHGFTDSLDTWYDLGYVDALKREHKLVLIDARGHGASDKPHQTSAYTNEARANDVVEMKIAADRASAHVVLKAPKPYVVDSCRSGVAASAIHNTREYPIFQAPE
jgi:alpha-beta hydrolase superfamily lysophospholipase